MRVIKFRAWYEGEMSEVYSYSLSDNRVTIGLSRFPYSHQVYPESIMQFTGLLDKNGKGIYHHDIFRSNKGKLFEVVWSNKKHGWAVHYIGNPDHNPYKSMNWAINNGEIIGNIYENPELLK